MKIGLLVFPSLYDTHSAASVSSDLGQRLEPSVLALVSQRQGDVSVFIHDNVPHESIDMYLCSVYTRGWEEFCEFSRLVGKEKIIAGGYHPTARPQETGQFAHKVVVGLCGNIEEILDEPKAGVYKGKVKHRLMQRSLLNMGHMQQVYPDVMPGMGVGSSVSSVGCPYDCAFCATPQMSGRKMSAYDTDLIREDIEDLLRYNTKVVFIRDESFATHPNFEEAVNLYGHKKFEVLYSFGTSAAMNEKKFKILQKAHWHSLCLGLEDVGENYKKNKNLQSVCDMARDHEVGITLSFIVNDKKKGFEEMVKNYKALTSAFFDLNPIMVCANFFMPLPGTRLGDSPENRVDASVYKEFDSKTPLYSSPELSALHRKLAVAVQLNWYESKEYAKIRNFYTGDTLHRRMMQLKEAFKIDLNDPVLQELITP